MPQPMMPSCHGRFDGGERILIQRSSRQPCFQRERIQPVLTSSLKKKFPHVNTASIGYNVVTEWYTNTGATDHITSEFDKLTTREKYGGTDQVHVANGSGMPDIKILFLKMSYMFRMLLKI
jgi:hypothetical protein